MPVVETKGSASSQGFGEFAKQGGGATYIEDVFSTWLYTGNGNARSITNGINYYFFCFYNSSGACSYI